MTDILEDARAFLETAEYRGPDNLHPCREKWNEEDLKEACRLIEASDEEICSLRKDIGRYEWEAENNKAEQKGLLSILFDLTEGKRTKNEIVDELRGTIKDVCAEWNIHYPPND